jgi:hypothetical protein
VEVVQVMADALALPHELKESTILTAILQLIAPDRLEEGNPFGYLSEAHQARSPSSFCKLCAICFRFGEGQEARTLQWQCSSDG